MPAEDYLDRWELEAWQRYQTELALISRVAEMRNVSRRDINDLGHLAARAAIQESVAPIAASEHQVVSPPATPPPLPDSYGQGVPPPNEDEDLGGFERRLKELQQRTPRGVGV